MKFCVLSFQKPPTSCLRTNQPKSPTTTSSHQSPLHCRASAGRLPRPQRPNGHPPALGRRTTTPHLKPASPFHSRTPLSLKRSTRFYTRPSRGNRQDSLNEFSAPFVLFFRFFCSTIPPHRGGGLRFAEQAGSQQSKPGAFKTNCRET